MHAIWGANGHVKPVGMGLLQVVNVQWVLRVVQMTCNFRQHATVGLIKMRSVWIKGVVLATHRAIPRISKSLGDAGQTPGRGVVHDPLHHLFPRWPAFFGLRPTVSLHSAKGQHLFFLATPMQPLP